MWWALGIVAALAYLAAAGWFCSRIMRYVGGKR